MKKLKKIILYFLLPVFIAGLYIWFNFPRIFTHGINSDELIYISRTRLWEAYSTGDVHNPIWQSWDAYDQPPLAPYIYGLGLSDYAHTYGGYKDLMLAARLIDADALNPVNNNSEWQNIGGIAPKDFPVSAQLARDLVIRTRTIAIIATGLTLALLSIIAAIAIHPIAGLIAPLIAGQFSLLGHLGVMGMIDPLLYFWYTLGLLVIVTLKKGIFKSVLLGLIIGIAVSIKFNAGSLAVIFFLTELLPLAKKPIRITSALKNLVITGIIAGSVFLATNPYLWENPIPNTMHMLESRTTAFSSQQTDNTSVSLTAPDARFQAIKIALASGITFDPPPTMVTLVTAALILSLVSAWTGNLSANLKWLSSAFLVELTLLLFYLPLNWDRYFLPLMPAASLVISSLLFTLPSSLKRIWNKRILFTVVLILTALLLAAPPLSAMEWLIVCITLILVIQGAISTLAMSFTLFDDKLQQKQPDELNHHQTTFSLLVPAKHEAQVIGDTIKAIHRINYPKHLFEAMLLIPAHDIDTILQAQKTIEAIEATNIRILELDGDTNTKSYSLNIGLHFAKHQIVGVFDAEDEPRPSILKRINQEFNRQPQLDVIQASIQLTNINSSWYGPLNSLEYFFWFKSVLPFLATFNAGLIAGNTVFIKKTVLNRVQGWDELCLTEDADLGVRLHQQGCNTGFIFDKHITTFEEVPQTVTGLIRQRSRWDQGFMQVLQKINWHDGLTRKQRLLLIYTLIQPLFRHLMLLNMIILPILVNQVIGPINIAVAMISWTPTYFVFIQIVLYMYGLNNLKQIYSLRFSRLTYLLLPVVFFPYQLLLSLGSLRAIIQQFRGISRWDKTDHHNLHREDYAQITYT
jgi:glycosyltransferase XagB